MYSTNTNKKNIWINIIWIIWMYFVQWYYTYIPLFNLWCSFMFYTALNYHRSLIKSWNKFLLVVSFPFILFPSTHVNYFITIWQENLQCSKKERHHNNVFSARRKLWYSIGKERYRVCNIWTTLLVLRYGLR